MAGFADQELALRLRDVISRTVREIISVERPEVQFGSVVDITRNNRSARVVINGDTPDHAIACKFTYTCEPVTPGQIVKIEKIRGAHWITDIISGYSVNNQLGIAARDQLLMSGGGAISWDNSKLSWSQRFIVIGRGRDLRQQQGYYDITMPPVGTVIPIHGTTEGGPTSVTVASTGIDMTVGGTAFWNALWYDPPYGDTTASVPENFHIVDYRGDFDMPPGWVMVASMRADATSPSLLLGTGIMVDHLRAPVLTNGWVNYGAPWDNASYTKDGSMNVSITGLVKFGTISTDSAAAQIFNLPIGFRPRGPLIYTVDSNGGPARMNVLPTGQVYAQSGTNGYMSLSGIVFRADN